MYPLKRGPAPAVSKAAGAGSPSFEGVQKRDDVPLSRPRKGGVGTPGTQQSLDTGGPPRLSEKLKLAFPDVVAVAKPNIKDQTIKDSH